VLLIALCVLAGWIPLANSQGRPQPPSLAQKVQVTPYFGAFILEDRAYDNAVFLGARVGTDISQQYSIEGGLAYASTEFSVDVNNVRDREAVGMLLLFADFLYNYPLSPAFIAFGSFGMGGLSLNPESDRHQTDAFFNFGGGLKAFLRPDLLLRLEVRQYSPDFDIAFFNPRSGTAFVSPSGSPKSKVQKILTIAAGLTFVL